MEDHSSQPSIRLPIRIRIEHPELGTVELDGVDLWDDGIVVPAPDGPTPPIGTLMQGQVQDDVPDRPVMNLRLAGITERGWQLAFEE